MIDGFVKVAAATPKIKVADCVYNADRIIELIGKAYDKGVNLIVFPELCVTGYSCGDLFFQNSLIKGAIRELSRIVYETSRLDIISVVGAPYSYNSKLYNVAFVIYKGVIQGAVPKSYIANYAEFYEKRHFASGRDMDTYVGIDSDNTCVHFSTKCIFRMEDMPEFSFGVEICEDLWAVNPPSNRLATAGANIILNLSASDEMVGKSSYRRELVKGQSARLIAGYVYASAGGGESTTDVVYSGHNIIAENGAILAQANLYEDEMIITEIDCQKLENDRRRNSSFEAYKDDEIEVVEIFSNDDFFEEYLEEEFFDNEDEFVDMDELDNIDVGCKNIDKVVDFRSREHIDMEEMEDVLPQIELTRYIDKAPFVPSDKNNRDERCREILDIQMMGLVKRLEHIGCKNVVIGISGGLDSTLALIVAVRAFDRLGLDRKNIIAVTMPCFGTTDRTYNNAVSLVKELGATIKEVDIKKSVTLHFEDIGHDIDVHDITYENGQARERTQVLMDLANKYNGIVIGTGDMSELALGWATYNGDHMSMYGVNCSVPKTLVRYLVSFYAENTSNKTLSKVLMDVLDTPVSPELLPPTNNGKIAQKTEDLVGPYELHDFFLYYVLRCGFEPRKIFRLAKYAFKDEYNNETILKWLRTFYRRFFAQQFKRSCIPDGPKVGSITLSPRGELRMPSDACARIWLEEVDKLNV